MSKYKTFMPITYQFCENFIDLNKIFLFFNDKFNIAFITLKEEYFI